MSSIIQAKAEAQKLIKKYNQLQAEAKTANAEEASRKAAEAQKLVAQISSLQTAITKLQVKDKEKEKERVKTISGNKEEPIKDEEIKRTEAEKTALEARIARIEGAQKKTREQIEQLNRAKRELARLRTEAEQNRERRANDEKLQQELTKLIDKKEGEHLRLKQELDMIRQQAQKDAELLKAQRDAARAIMERQKQLEKDHSSSHKGGSGKKGLVIGILIGVLSIGIVAVLAVTTHLLNGLIGEGKKTQGSVSSSEAEKTSKTTDQGSKESTPAKTQEADDKPTPVKSLGQYRDNLSRGGYGPMMVKLPAGDFMMGSKGSSPYQDERPQVAVHLEGFSISKYEITFEEYDRFASDTGRTLPEDKGWGRANYPVINVDWDDATEYGKWLTEQTGHQYRLPSEREWEYAATAGTKTPYWWGYEIGKSNANCSTCGSQWDARQTAPVGSFQGNAFGIYDVIGNVLEWTVSCFRSSYQGMPQFGQVWEGGDCSQRMVRSSSYRTYENGLRVTKRSKFSPKTRMDTLGFRVVRVD